MWATQHWLGGSAMCWLRIIGVCSLTLIAWPQPARAQADKQPVKFDHARIEALIYPVTVTPNGERIIVRMTITGKNPAEDLYMGIPNLHMTGASDNYRSARCGFTMMNTRVLGLPVAISGKHQATRVSAGSSVTVQISMLCDPPARGDRMTVSSQVVIYVGNPSEPERIAIGNIEVPVVKQAD